MILKVGLMFRIGFSTSGHHCFFFEEPCFEEHSDCRMCLRKFSLQYNHLGEYMTEYKKKQTILYMNPFEEHLFLKHVF